MLEDEVIADVDVLGASMASILATDGNHASVVNPNDDGLFEGKKP
jgi:hypothetical protein